MLRAVPRALSTALLAAAAAAPAVRAQPPAGPTTHVDSAGVWRWRADGREVVRFGVNYAAPFAYDLRAIRRVGGDPRAAIRADVAHFARLGLDAFRIHVWDREVSDSTGALLATEPLDLLDFLLAELAARGIAIVLTPIAWWGPGYPEPDPPSPGFSNRFTKEQLSTDPAAWSAQVRYLREFAAHVNPHTGRAYRDEPSIIAWETINEPFHAGSPAVTTRYVDTLVLALREAGVRTPIFHNVSERYDPEQARAVCRARIDGVTAQWYPTGLVRGATIPVNPLPTVDRYEVPWETFPECRGKARLIYEFDGADVAAPVMHAAMARSFRAAGFQWATQFAYDPLAIAGTNTEYQTHFLNLVHTPGKAVALFIAGAAFRSLPRGQAWPAYPASERFGDVRVSWADRTTEWVSDTVFAHAAPTTTRPSAPQRLRRVVGVGRSPIVGYEGTGAYFLDRLDHGVWRLEVYPDVIRTADPFSAGSLDRLVTRVVHRRHSITVRLPDLGRGFTVTPLDSGNGHRPAVTGETFAIRPGVYRLTRRGVAPARPLARSTVHGVGLREYHAPATSPITVFAAAGAGRSEPSRVVLPGFVPGVSWRTHDANGPDGGWRFTVESWHGDAPFVGFRTTLGEEPSGWVGPARDGTLVLRARAVGAAPVTVDVALTFADGRAVGTRVTLPPQWTTVRIPVRELAPVPLLLLPRPYPGFHPWTLPAPDGAARPDWSTLDGVQWRLDRDVVGRGVELARLTLEPGADRP